MAEIKVYGAPWCPDCRQSKQLLTDLAIEFDWFDIDQDEEAAGYVRERNGGKQIIPTVVFADGSQLVEPSNDELARKLGRVLKAKQDYYDLIVIGGGPTGLTAAIYGAREGLECLVIDKGGLGGQAAITERIDNYPGFPEGVEGRDLAGRFVGQAKRYGVELLSAVSVASIERQRDKTIVTTTTGEDYSAAAIILASGSTYRRLGVPGEDDHLGAGIHFCATCDGPFYKGAKELVVVGGGNSGVEEGLFLSQFVDHITLIEFMPELKASRLLQDQIHSNPKFTVLTNTEVLEFQGDGKLSTILTRDRGAGEVSQVEASGAFIFIGMRPNVEFLDGAVELEAGGFIKTDESLQTSLPGDFAAGDVRSGSTKQLVSAAGEGAEALLMVRQFLHEQAANERQTAGELIPSAP